MVRDLESATRAVSVRPIVSLSTAIYSRPPPYRRWCVIWLSEWGLLCRCRAQGGHPPVLLHSRGSDRAMALALAPAGAVRVLGRLSRGAS